MGAGNTNLRYNRRSLEGHTFGFGKVLGRNVAPPLPSQVYRCGGLTENAPRGAGSARIALGRGRNSPLGLAELTFGQKTGIFSLLDRSEGCSVPMEGNLLGRVTVCSGLTCWQKMSYTDSGHKLNGLWDLCRSIPANM